MNTWLNDVYNFEQLLFFKLCDFFYVFFLIVLSRVTGVCIVWCPYQITSLFLFLLKLINMYVYMYSCVYQSVCKYCNFHDHVTVHYVMLCYVMLCYVMLCSVMLCYTTSKVGKALNWGQAREATDWH